MLLLLLLVHTLKHISDQVGTIFNILDSMRINGSDKEILGRLRKVSFINNQLIQGSS